MKAKILFLAGCLTACGLRAQTTSTNGLSHDELLKRAASNGVSRAAANTVAPGPDWAATNAPRPADASGAAATPATLSPAEAEAARAAANRAAAQKMAQVRAATTNRPAFNRPGRNLPGLPGAPGAAPASPAATPVTAAAANPTPVAGAVPAASVAPGATPADLGAMAIRPPSTASTVVDPDKIIPPLSINFTAATLENVLEIYCEYVGRNLLRPGVLPKADIVLKQTTPLTKLEVVQMLEAALYLNQVSVVNVGEKFVTVVPTAEAFKIPGIINTNATHSMPDLGSIVTHVVQLKYNKPSEMQQVLTPFASGTAANPIMPLEGSGMLVLRDNVANVKRMLEMIEKVDVVAQSEIVSEVIPIKYAKAEEIASALSSVGGGTGGTVGTRSSSTGVTSRTGASGANRTSTGGYNPNNPSGLPGAMGSTPTPSSNATFGDRVRNLISKAAGSGEFSILGETKIIADIRSNSLLVFASRQDMEMIKDIIAKLDVVLAQVLIETIILDVTYSDNWKVGVSGAQNPERFSGQFRNASGGGNNGAPFNAITNALPSALPQGLSYFGTLGNSPSFEVAVSAFASDNKVKVIQKPRIQTSHATPASIFIGSTVPYVTGTYYGYGAGTGGSSSYQQLKVGIGLDVTPFINADGLVVMQIQETIDELDGSTEIQNVGLVPNTKSSTLSAEIAVRDKETIILGGIIRNSHDSTKSGVPLLKDIPLVGALFSSNSSNKKRQELIVMMRPTVLRTPEIAAMQVDVEKQRLPGVRSAEEELDRIELQRSKKEEKSRSKKSTSNQQATPAQPSFNQAQPFSPDDEKVLNPPPVQSAP